MHSCTQWKLHSYIIMRIATILYILIDSLKHGYHSSKNSYCMTYVIDTDCPKVSRIDHSLNKDGISNLGAKTKSTNRRCGQCANCQQADCGMCKFCKDKPHFGGPGRLNQPCIKRKCIRLGKPKPSK